MSGATDEHHASLLATSVVATVAIFDGDGCQIVRIGDVSAFAVSAQGQVDELFAADASLRYRRQGSHDDRTAVVI